MSLNSMKMKNILLMFPICSVFVPFCDFELSLQRNAPDERDIWNDPNINELVGERQITPAAHTYVWIQF